MFVLSKDNTNDPAGAQTSLLLIINTWLWLTRAKIFGIENQFQSFSVPDLRIDLDDFQSSEEWPRQESNLGILGVNEMVYH